MQIDRIAVMVRPRNPWEAMDLGMRMALTWWKPVYGAWLAAYLPVIAIITWICAELNQPWIALIAVLWVKPLLERVPLLVLSRAVFGDVPSIADALRAIPGLLRIAPLWRLLLLRWFSFNRAFCLPVILLEGLRGKERRARLRILLKGMASAPVWLTLVCIFLTTILALGSYSLLDLFLPRTLEADLGFKELYAQGLPDWYLWTCYGIIVFANMVIGPLYVASGFSLYLNRRTLLEGWDIELGFRRMAQRLGQGQPPGQNISRAAVLLLCVLGLSTAMPPDANAAPSNAEAQQHIDQVMRRPEFSTKKTVENWRYIGKINQDENVGANAFWQSISTFGKALAWIVKGFFYLLLFAAVVWLIINHRRWLNWVRGIQPTPRYQPPAQLFGLDIRPESLPANVAEAAYQLWQSGDARGALSLLYRGALSRLAQQENVNLKASDTEGDCLRVVQHTQAPSISGYFARLTTAWQAVAYAGRAPQAAEGEALCRAYPEHFGVAQ